jgi:hypothetical protein
MRTERDITVLHESWRRDAAAIALEPVMKTIIISDCQGKTRHESHCRAIHHSAIHVSTMMHAMPT